MSGVSWREAGFPEKEGRAVRLWVMGQLRNALRDYNAFLDSHGGSLENDKLTPGPLLDITGAALTQLARTRDEWQRVLDGIDHGGAAGFVEAHGRWTRAGQSWP